MLCAGGGGPGSENVPGGSRSSVGHPVGCFRTRRGESGLLLQPEHYYHYYGSHGVSFHLFCLARPGRPASNFKLNLKSSSRHPGSSNFEPALPCRLARGSSSRSIHPLSLSPPPPESFAVRAPPVGKTLGVGCWPPGSAIRSLPICDLPRPARTRLHGRAEQICAD
jgi:hypothetical protein